MNYADKMRRAAAEANGFIAELTGQPPTATANALYKGEPVTVNFGRARVVEIPMQGGRFRRRVDIPASIAKTELARKPETQTVLIRLFPVREEYTIMTADGHDALFYNLTLLKAGDPPEQQ